MIQVNFSPVTGSEEFKYRLEANVPMLENNSLSPETCSDWIIVDDDAGQNFDEPIVYLSRPQQIQ